MTTTFQPGDRVRLTGGIRTDESALSQLSDKLGLGAPEAASALEIGARLLAHGFTDADVDQAVKNRHQDGAPSLQPLRDLQRRIGEANAAKGFHEEGDWLREGLQADRDPEVTPYIGDALRNYYTARLALITTEVAEAIEELRNGRAVDETWYSGENSATQPRKPEGVPSELADVVIRSLDLAEEAGIDLAAIIEEKLAYNNTRAHKHGRTF